MPRHAFLIGFIFLLAGMSFAAPQAGGTNITIQVNGAATGDPIAQADVYADQDHTTTDDFGQCELTLPDRGQYFAVRVSQKGFVDMGVEWRDLKPGEKLPSQLTFNMAPGTSIGGKVVDENGQPVSGAVVHLISEDRVGNGVVHAEMNIQPRTDAAGAWSSDAAPVDLKRVYYRVTAPGFYSVGYYSNVQSADQLRDRSAVFTISHAARISGTVLDPSGKPVAGAAVTAGDQGMGGVPHRATTDAGGHFTLDNLHPGPVNFAVFSQQFAPRIVSVNTPAAQPAIVHLQPGKTMKFHIIDKAGNPLNGASIAVSQWHNANFFDFTLHTDAQGNATWAGAPDDEIQMTISKRYLGTIVDKPFKASESPIHLTLGRPTKITGTVIDAATGSPVTNFTVRVGITWRNAEQIYWENQGEWGTNSDIEPNGHFTYTPRQPYPGYELRVEAPGYEPCDSEQFDTDAGELSLVFKMQKGTGIGGTVFDSKHQPVANATVYLALPGRAFQIFTDAVIPEWQQGSSVQADARGHYEFAPQVDAFDLICITHEGIARIDAPALHPQKPSNLPPGIALSPMPATRPASYDLQIQPWATIDGKMLVGDKPAAHVDMQLQGVAQGWRQDAPQVWFNYEATTDAEGNFHFDHVPPVAMQVGRVMKIQNSETPAENIPVDPKPGETVNMQIGGGREIVGKFAVPANFPAGNWFAWSATMRAHMVTPPSVQMPLAIRMGSDEARKKWQAEMVKRPEFQAYLAQQKKLMASSHGLWVKPDGSFHVDNVEPGTYDLSAQFFPNSVMNGGDWNHPLGASQKQIIIPPGPSDPPLNIGTIPITPPQ